MVEVLVDYGKGEFWCAPVFTRRVVLVLHVAEKCIFSSAQVGEGGFVDMFESGVDGATENERVPTLTLTTLNAIVECGAWACLELFESGVVEFENVVVRGEGRVGVEEWGFGFIVRTDGSFNAS